MSTDETNTFPISDRRSYLWLFLGAALGLFTYGQWSISFSLWLSIPLIIRFIHTQKPLRGYVILCIVRVFLTAVVLGPVLPSTLFPRHIWYAIIIGSSLSGSLPYLADRLISPHIKGVGATFVFPTAFTAWEFATLAINPLGTFGALAYSQYGNLTLMQLVSVTGLSGLSFLITWFGSTVNWIWERSFTWSSIRRGGVPYATVMVLVLMGGGARLAWHQPTSGTMQIASFSLRGIGADFRTLVKNDRSEFRRKSLEAHDRYFDETRRQADSGAQLILWPEAAGICASEDEDELIQRGQELADEKGIYLAMPLFTQHLEKGGRPENKLIIVDPDGEVVLEHFKYGGNQFEGSVLGNGLLQTFQTPSAKISGVICWDMDFPQIVSQVGRNGTDILLAPANDWETVSATHANMAAFRAIENGVSLVRQAKNGMSLVTDPYGRTLAKMDHFTTTKRLMVAQVSNEGVATVYSVVGDLFAWASAVAFLFLACAALDGGWRNRFGRART
jgi:apolipoprotein N-acyltransferase